MRVVISLLLFLIFSLSGYATTWYVRNDGGNYDECTGLVDAPYPGSGKHQDCAVADLYTVVGDGGNCNSAEDPDACRGRAHEGDTIVLSDGSEWQKRITNVIQGPNTVLIVPNHNLKVGQYFQIWGLDGCNDLNYARVKVGAIDGDAITIVRANDGGAIDSTGFPPYRGGGWIGSGHWYVLGDKLGSVKFPGDGGGLTSIKRHLKIVGKGKDRCNAKLCDNKPFIWGNGVNSAFTLGDNAFLELECITIGQIPNYNDGHQMTVYSGIRKAFVTDGWYFNGTIRGLFLTNVDVFNTNRVMLINRWKKLIIRGCNFVGQVSCAIDSDIGGPDPIRGYTAIQYSRLDWTGCYLTVPLTRKFKETMARAPMGQMENQLKDFDSVDRCYTWYGDVIGLGDGPAGDWEILFTSMQHATSDGYDVVHGTGDTATRIRGLTTQGILGMDIKGAGRKVLIQDSVFASNCEFFRGAPFDHTDTAGCRADGFAIGLDIGVTGYHATIVNTTSYGGGNVSIITQGSKCDGTEIIRFINCVQHGASNANLLYFGGSNGDGAGPCGPGKPTTPKVYYDHTIYWHGRHNQTLPEPAWKTDPKFVEDPEWLDKGWGGPRYDEKPYLDFRLRPDSPAINYSTSTPYDPSIDSFFRVRKTPYDAGGIEYGSVPPVAKPRTYGSVKFRGSVKLIGVRSNTN